MVRVIVRWTGWVCFMLIQFTSFSQQKEKVEFSAVLETETAYEFENQDLQKSELVFTPELSYKLGKQTRIVGIGRLYAEWTDHLEPGSTLNDNASRFSGRLDLGDRAELELRELYVDFWTKKGASFRIGKQQVVWGETDGLKLLDVVNPQYFREFVLDDFDESRIPLWSAKADLPVTNNLDLQIIWIPDLTYHSVPNGRFFPGRFFVPQPPPNVEPQLLSSDKPDDPLKDGDFGLKLGTFLAGWDLNFNYLYHYNDLPNFAFNLNQTGVSIRPDYNRQHMAGLAFNKATGSFVLRGEIAYHFNAAFAGSDFFTSEGIVRSDQWQSAIGLDWTGGEAFASIQIFSDWIKEDVEVFNRDQLVWSGSLLLSQEFMNDNLKVESLFVHDWNRGDGVIRPSASYLMSSQLTMKAGGDFFYGDSTGLFGQFNSRDRIYLGFELGI